MNKTKTAVLVAALLLLGTASSVIAVRHWRKQEARTAGIAALVNDARFSEPQKLFLRALNRYRSANTVSMRIQHQDTSPLFPGNYTQLLRWKQGGRFELVTTANNTADTVPNCYGDGTRVVVVRPSGSKFSEPLDANGANGGEIADWELAGGQPLSILQGTQRMNDLIAQITLSKMSWSFGPRTLWQGQAVRELKAVRPDGTSGGSAFLSPRGDQIVGVENTVAGRSIWELYTEQRLDEPMPETLGNAPG